MTHHTIAHVVGIDVSKSELDVAVRPSGLRLTVRYDAEGLDRLTHQLRELSPELVVVEATGGIERALAVALSSAGLRVAVVNARHVRDFARATGQLAKTDRIDAGVTAWYGDAIRPEPRPIADQAAADRQALVTRRRQLVKLLGVERTHLASAAQVVRENIGEQIAHLRAALDEIDERIAASVAADEGLSARRALIRTLKGIGAVASAALVVTLPELGQLTRGEIAKLVGVAPLNNDSGARRGKRGCWGGREPVRTALYMPAMTAVRWNPVIKAFYERLTARGKPHKVAIIACMHKMLTILNAMVRTNTPWTPDRELSS